MNGETVGYKAQNFIGLVRSWAGTTLLQDADQERDLYAIQELDARVRSGDYFVTLATTLDQISGTMDDYTTRAKLEEIVSDLIYLQDTYTIEKSK